MRVVVAQLDGKIPNLALMRIGQHHRERGDDVQLVRIPRPEVVRQRAFDDVLQQAERVYASAIFEWTRPVAEALRQMRPDVILGGTGIDLAITLAQYGIPDAGAVDYTLYPHFTASLGFTQRGCRLKCPFCVVPRKEGAVREAGSIASIWRGDPWPRHVILLDNDFFGNPQWPARIAELQAGGFKVSFNQGINARMLNAETAAAIASVQYADDAFQSRRIYTAWDNRKDEGRLFAGLRALQAAGVRPDHVMVYMLIGYWPGETSADWEYRRQQLRAFGARPYPMPFVRTRETVGFQRFVIGAYDKRVTWAEWQAAGHDARKLHFHGREAGQRELFPA